MDDCQFTIDDVIILEAKLEKDSKFYLEPVGYSLNKEKFAKEEGKGVKEEALCEPRIDELDKLEL